MSESRGSFDFEAMVKLARDDPAGFDRMRSTLIDSFVRGRHRSTELASLQQALDAERGAAADAPAVTAEELSRRMWRSFGHLTSEFERLAGLTAAVSGTVGDATVVAKLGAGEAAPK